MQQSTTLYITIFLVAALITTSYGKRGCSLYGHSCFGGHGKRSDISVPEGIALDTPVRIFQENNDDSQEIPIESLLARRQFEKDYKMAVYSLLKQWMKASSNNKPITVDATNDYTRNNNISS